LTSDEPLEASALVFTTKGDQEDLVHDIPLQPAGTKGTLRIAWPVWAIERVCQQQWLCASEQLVTLVATPLLAAHLRDGLGVRDIHEDSVVDTIESRFALPI